MLDSVLVVEAAVEVLLEHRDRTYLVTFSVCFISYVNSIHLYLTGHGMLVRRFHRLLVRQL